MKYTYMLYLGMEFNIGMSTSWMFEGSKLVILKFRYILYPQWLLLVREQARLTSVYTYLRVYMQPYTYTVHTYYTRIPV